MPEELARQVAAAVHLHEVRNRLRRLSLALDQELGLSGRVGVPVEESTSKIRHLVAIGGNAEVMQVDLGNGTNWWSTRLYLLAMFAEDLTGGQAILFVDGESYVGLIRPHILRREMLSVHPEFVVLDRNVRRTSSGKQPQTFEIDRRLE